MEIIRLCPCGNSSPPVEDDRGNVCKPCRNLKQADYHKSAAGKAAKARYVARQKLLNPKQAKGPRICDCGEPSLPREQKRGTLCHQCSILKCRETKQKKRGAVVNLTIKTAPRSSSADLVEKSVGLNSSFLSRAW